MQRPLHAVPLANLAHQNDRVRIAKLISTFNRTVNQVVQSDFMRGIQQHRGELLMIISMFHHPLFIGTKIHAKQISRNPIMVFVQDLMIDIVEQLKLKRIAGPVDRFHTIDHRSTHAVNKVPIKVGNRLIEFFIELRPPFLPLLAIKIPHGDSTPRTFKYMKIIRADQFPIPDLFR